MRSPGPLLGLDPGTKTIGVALSDWDWSIASPMETIQRSSFKRDADHLQKLTDQENVAGIIIGMPFNADGTVGPRAQSVRAFRRNLADILPLPMLFWDERYSTAQAQELLQLSNAETAKQNGRLDAAAAAIILTDALKTLSTKRGDTNR
ncbi:MAG: Holliday junction resolvase RuvX [Pseudomonadota bacterium]